MFTNFAIYLRPFEDTKIVDNNLKNERQAFLY